MERRTGAPRPDAGAPGATPPSWYRPVADRLVVRGRLLDLLDERSALTVLRAPIGFGKTTLARIWAETRGTTETEVVTVPLATATTRAGVWGRVVAALDGTGAPARSTATAATAQALLTRYAGRVTLVLDRLDVGLDDALVDDLLGLLDAVPALDVVACLRDRVSVSGTTDGSVDRPADRLARAGRTIDARELGLSLDEAADLVAASGVDRSRERVRALHEHVGGWPALLRQVVLALAGSSGQVDELSVAARVAHEFVTHQVLSGLTPDEAELLCSLAVPRRLTLVTAAQALDLAERETTPVLARLVGLAVLTPRAEEGETVFTWAPAIRAALRSTLETDHPETARRLDHRLALWHLGRREPAAALEHAAARGDAALVVEVLDRYWLPLLVYDNTVMTEIFRHAPEEWLDARPFLHGVRDLALRLPGDPAVAGLGRPRGSAATPPDPGADVRASMNGGLVELFALRKARRLGEALDLALRLQRQALAARVVSSGEVSDLLAPVFLLTGIVHELAGDPQAAVAPLRWGYETGALSTLRGSSRHCASHLAMNLALLGDTTEARGWLERAEASPQATSWVRPRAEISGEVARVLAALDRLDRPAARESLRRLLSLDDPHDELWPFVLYARAQYALVWGDRVGAIQNILAERASRPGWVGTGSALDAIVRAAEVDLLLALGHRRQAMATLRGVQTGQALLDAPRARLALLAGRPDAALGLVRDCLLTRPAVTRAREDLVVLDVVALARTGAVDRARDRLERLLAEDAVSARAWVMAPGTDLADLARDLSVAAPLLARLEEAQVREVFPASLAQVRLTGREQVILQHLAHGHARDDIARRLSVSSHTVKSQTHSIYRKLGVRSRGEALVAAREHGLLPGGDGDGLPGEWMARQA